ncbi:MAG TPA: RHS repeat-associated core domain-containing protein [Candidatus Angelobacter sp.]|jgi:RHS repeat-associated protein|nr:RHS repeat-associated core domain-containing protein [Candidatus Angelobacter sp.]
MRKLTAIVFLVTLGLVLSSAGQSRPDQARGSRPFASYVAYDFDKVELTNGNLDVRIPLVSYPQRGGILHVDLTIYYSGKTWFVNCGAPPTTCFWDVAQTPTGLGVAIINNYGMLPLAAFDPSQSVLYYNRLQFMDGAAKLLAVTSASSPIPNELTTVDTSGIKVVGAFTTNPPFTTTVITPDGVRAAFTRDPNQAPPQQAPESLPAVITDPNGNQLVTDGRISLTDTMGRVIPLMRDSTTQSRTIDLAGCPAGASQTDVYSMPGINGTTFPIKICRSSFQLDTNFGTTGITEFHHRLAMISGIVLPNQKSWIFSYNSYGDLASITTPHGGTVNYQWQTGNVLCGTQSSRFIVERDLDAGDGSGTKKWTYGYSLGSGFDPTTSTQVVTDPDGNQTQSIVQRLPAPDGTASCTLEVVQQKHYQGAVATGTLLETDETDYSVGGLNTFAGDISTYNTVPKARRKILPNGQISEVDYIYDTGDPGDTFSSPTPDALRNPGQFPVYGPLVFSTPTRVDDYDYGQGVRGKLLRSVVTDYFWHHSRSDYGAGNLIDLIFSRSTLDNNGKRAAETDYSYDDPARLFSSGISTQHTSAPGTVRGNQTSITRWLNTGATPVSYSNWYDTGEKYQDIDGLRHTTTYAYDPVFAGAYVTQTTTEVPDVTGVHAGSSSQSTSALYDFNTGLLTSFSDANSQITTYTYNDPLYRLTKVTRPPGGGSTSVFYGDDVRNTYHQTLTDLDGTNSLQSYKFFDGFDRPVRLVQFDGTANAPWIATDTFYDSLGRIGNVSLPYRIDSPSAVRASCGTCMTTTYDAIGRITAQATSDGAQVSSGYTGNVTTVTDQALKTRQSTHDSLGRLTQVVENPTQVNGESSQTTTFGYDALDNLASVNQGAQQRFYLHDSLDRLVRENNPEDGINASLSMTDPVTNNSQWSIGYSYDANNNLISRTDARGITTNILYDALNREITRSYQNDPTNTPQVDRFWDGKGTTALVSNALGRITAVSSSVAGRTYDNYNPMGWVLQTTQTLNAQPYPVQYGYDLAGHVTSETYPSGRTVSTGFDVAGRSTSITGQLGTTGTPVSYTDSIKYSPHGEVIDLRMGNDLWQHFAYDANRLQTTEVDVGTTQAASDLLQIKYDYGTTNNNGNPLRQVITAPGMTVTQLYKYDAFNRLNGAQESNGDVSTWQPSAIWEQDLTYDRYGNRTGVSVTPGLPTFVPVASVDSTTNRFVTGSGFNYDLAGNLIQESIDANTQNSYTYDAESRLIESTQNGVSSASFRYDGDGRRVEKIVSGQTTVYVYDSNALVAEYGPATGAAGTQYLAKDALGSTRLITASDASVVARYDLMPFGELVPAGFASRSSIPGYGPLGSTRQLLTGKERDAETGLDFFEARYYASIQGRFTSPDDFKDGGFVDPVTGQNAFTPGPLAYADLGDPQTFNKYAYVRNNPTRYTDPNGHCIEDLCIGEGIAVAAAFKVTADFIAYLQTPQGKDSARAAIEGTGLLINKAADGIRSLFIKPQPKTAPAVDNSPLRFKPEVKDRVEEKAGGKCEYCGVATVKPEKSQKGVKPPPNERQTDHYDPRAKNGADTEDNAVNSCRTCNREKSDTQPKGTKWELPRMNQKPPDQEE